MSNESDKNTLCIALLYRYGTHIRTNFHDIFIQLIVLLFIFLVSFKIINLRSHNRSLFCIIKIWANALILIIYLESFMSCNELT